VRCCDGGWGLVLVNSHSTRPVQFSFRRSDDYMKYVSNCTFVNLSLIFSISPPIILYIVL
jgi:hypothetical protein